jgi:hypothetical protein
MIAETFGYPRIIDLIIKVNMACKFDARSGSLCRPVTPPGSLRVGQPQPPSRRLVLSGPDR